MKFIVTTFFFPNYKVLAEKTTPNHKAYCQKHGYKYIAYDIGELYPYEKITGDGYKDLCLAGKIHAKTIIKTLWESVPKNKDFDFLFTIGCDAVITNMDKKLEELVEKYHNDIIIGSDKAGINTSQILIKNKSQDAYRYFLANLRAIENGETEHDQSYFWEHSEPFICKTPQKEMNSYDAVARLEGEDDPGNWTNGDFLVHLAGMTLEQRMSRIDHWLGRVR